MGTKEGIGEKERIAWSEAAEQWFGEVKWRRKAKHFETKCKERRWWKEVDQIKESVD